MIGRILGLAIRSKGFRLRTHSLRCFFSTVPEGDGGSEGKKENNENSSIVWADKEGSGNKIQDGSVSEKFTTTVGEIDHYEKMIKQVISKCKVLAKQGSSGVNSLRKIPAGKYKILKSLCLFSFLLGNKKFQVESFFSPLTIKELFNKSTVDGSESDRLVREMVDGGAEYRNEAEVFERRDIVIGALINRMMNYTWNIQDCLIIIACLIQTDSIGRSMVWNQWIMEQVCLPENFEKVREMAETNRTRITANRFKVFFELLEGSCMGEKVDLTIVSAFLRRVKELMVVVNKKQHLAFVSNFANHLLNCEEKIANKREIMDACREIIEEVFLPSLEEEIKSAFDFSKRPLDPAFLKDEYFLDYLKPGDSGAASNKFKGVLIGVPAYRRFIKLMNMCRLHDDGFMRRTEQIMIYLTAPGFELRIHPKLKKSRQDPRKDNQKIIVNQILGFFFRSGVGSHYVRTLEGLKSGTDYLTDLETANSAAKILVGEHQFGTEFTFKQFRIGEKEDVRWLEGFVESILRDFLVKSSDGDLNDFEGILKKVKTVSFYTSKDFVFTLRYLLSLNNKPVGDITLDPSYEELSQVNIGKLMGDRHNTFAYFCKLFSASMSREHYQIMQATSKKSSIQTLEQLYPQLERIIGEKVISKTNSRLVSDVFVPKMNLFVEIDDDTHRLYSSNHRIVWQTRLRNLNYIMQGSRLIVVDKLDRETGSIECILKCIEQCIVRMRENPDLQFIYTVPPAEIGS